MPELNYTQITLSEFTHNQILLAEIDGTKEGAILAYYDLTNGADRTVQTCLGDLYNICNTLDDYARLIDIVSKDPARAGSAMWYEVHAERLRRISNKLADRIGYNKAAALERCRKRKEEPTDDVGEDAMILAMRKRKSDAAAKAAATEGNKTISSEITFDDLKRRRNLVEPERD